MNNKFILYFLAFLEGFLVMVLEVLSKNFLTPYFGNSLTIWTIIIGNTFLFLSIGYMSSPLLFRKKPEKILLIILSVLAILIVILPFWSKYVSAHFLTESLYFGAIFSHLIVFGPVFVLFGLINPVLIECYSRLTQSAVYGSSTGKVFFVSTFGGILACLIITLLYLSDIEINVIILSISLLLIVLTVLIFHRERKLVISFVIVYLALLGLSYKIIFKDKISENGEAVLLYHANDLFGDLKVYDKFNYDVNYEYRYLNVNNISQTLIFNDSNVKSDWNYVHRISMISSMKRNGEALLVGMGGGTIASELQKLNMKLDIVDIDRRMFDLAQRYFYFKKKNCRFHVDDARYFLNKNKKQFDLIVFDVLNGESQPLNLFTTQGVGKMKKCLKPSSLIIVEFQEDIAEGISAYKSICNTFLKENLYVYTSIDPSGSDILILASLNPIDLSQIKRENFTENSKNLDWINIFLNIPIRKINSAFEDGIVLDDKVPILDKFLERTRNDWRKRNIDNILLF